MAAELYPVPLLLLWMWSWIQADVVDFMRRAYKGKDDVAVHTKVSALSACHARFPGRLTGCKAALPTTCCVLRRRQELCWAEARLLPLNSYVCRCGEFADHALCFSLGSCGPCR